MMSGSGHSVFDARFRSLFPLVVMVCAPWFCGAETYQEYVARHKRVQKMMNPMNVPVANVMNDAWAENPEYANPKDKPAPKKGPSVFSVKSSRDGCGQLTYPFGNK